MTRTYNVHPTDTVGQLKVLGEVSSNIPPAQQRLIYAGKLLDDDATLESCGVANESTVHIILRLQEDRDDSHPFEIVVPSIFRSRSVDQGAGERVEGEEQPLQDPWIPQGPIFSVEADGAPVDVLEEIWCRVEFIRARRSRGRRNGWTGSAVSSL
jgi:Ubiquitin family